jgi:phenylacetic acid degradation operon negative regulatory protein
MRYDIDNLVIKRLLRWDGVWRVVIFDIPEKHRDARVALSKKLKEMGFCQLQKSVFVFPFSCEKEIDFIKMFYQIEKFIILFNTKSFGEIQDLILKKRFDLF